MTGELAKEKKHEMKSFLPKIELRRCDPWNFFNSKK